MELAWQAHLGGGDGGGRRGGRERVAEDDDDAVPSKEHILDEAVLVDGLGLLLSLALLGYLGPHLLHVLEHHVTVTVERLHSAEQLLVVSHVDEHLRVRPHRLGEQGQRSLVELLLFVLLWLVRTGPHPPSKYIKSQEHFVLLARRRKWKENGIIRPMMKDLLLIWI